MVLKSHKSRIKGDLLSENLENLRKERKSEFPPPTFVKRRRNQTKYSQLSRKEKEKFKFLQFRDKKENIEIHSLYIKNRKRKME